MDALLAFIGVNYLTVSVPAHENITDRKRIERELEQILERERTLARTDDLTGHSTGGNSSSLRLTNTR